MNASEYAWSYLFTHGGVGTWNHYGGEEIDVEKTMDMLFQILEDGVDWDKTQPPIDGDKSEFTGTESESNRILVLQGVLILKNGGKIPCLSRFDLETNVFEMAEAMTRMGGIKEAVGRRIQTLLDYFIHYKNDYPIFIRKYPTFRASGMCNIENIHSNAIRWEKRILEQHVTGGTGTSPKKRI